jgi:2'-5' RNA ligase
LFFAIDLDAETRDAIARISAAVRDQVERHTTAKITWVHEDHLHLTLYFLGNADEEMEQRARAAVATGLPVAPFDLTFGGLGIFPPTGPPRVLWLGVAAGLAGVERLYEVAAARLRSAHAETTGFSPHLTLARFRSRTPRASLHQLAGIPASAGPCRIDRVTLYESRLSSSGPTYLPVAQAVLTR